MANPLNRGDYFSKAIVDEIINQVKGKSSLAVLSQRKPLRFNGSDIVTFTFDNEVNIVGESQSKGPGGFSLNVVPVRPIKVEYSGRVSDEFLFATEESKIDLLKEFNEGYAKKLAKALDLMAIHGINPRSGEKSPIIGDNNFNDKVNQEVTYNSSNPQLNIEDAIALIDGSDGETDGIILSPEVTSALSRVTLSGDPNGVRRYPEFEFGRVPENLGGLRLEKNKTVSAYNNIKALAGDFETSFKWGISKQLPLEIIQFGDPDNTGRDLKGYNEVLLRSETYLGWGIVNPESFAKVTGGQDA